jgi:hypothetical protein
MEPHPIQILLYPQAEGDARHPAHAATTDSDGFFGFEDVGPGRYQIHAVGREVFGVSDPFSLGADDSITVDVRAARALELRGHVSLEGTGPCTRGRVFLNGWSGLLRHAPIDERGAFAIHAVPADEYAVGVQCADMGVASWSWSPDLLLTLDRDTSVDWLVARGGGIEGKVLGFTLPPTLRARVLTERGTFQSEVDAGGHFSFQGIRHGPYRIELFVPGSPRIHGSRDGVLHHGDNLRVEIELTPSFSIGGVVLSENGAPLSGVLVTLTEEVSTSSLTKDISTAVAATTSRDGRFWMADMPASRYQVGVEERSYSNRCLTEVAPTSRNARDLVRVRLHFLGAYFTTRSRGVAGTWT